MSNIEEVTILTLKDGEKVELPIDIEQYLDIEQQAKVNKESGIFIKELKREINFFNIIDKKGKTKYLALPEQEKPKTLFQMGSTEREILRNENPDLYYKMEREEEENRIKIREIVKEQLKNGEDRRRKSFIEKRKMIFRDLAKQERLFGLQTTESKIQELDNFRKKDIKNKI